MDPVSLTLGIVPLIGGSIKLYRASHSRLKAFRHYSREVDRVQKQFERQRLFFLNEIHLTLRLVIEDESLVRDMVENGEHPSWNRKLESAMLEAFKPNSCQVLNEIVEEIGKAITSIQEGLECFSCLEQARFKGESTKDAVRRLRDRFKIAFDKSKFSELVSDLRSSNSDLRLLREQVSELCKVKQDDFTVTTTSEAARKFCQRRLLVEFTSYGATRRAAQALYDALWTAWSTRGAAKFRHLAKLFLETKADEGVYLNLIISCLRQDLAQPMIPTTVKVHVKSQILDWIPEQTAAASSDAERSRQKKRRRLVKFTSEENRDIEQAESDSLGAACEGKPQKPVTPDLRCSQHLCPDLLPKRLSSQPSLPSPAAPAGYLDTSSDDKYRHLFFHCCEGLCNPALCGRGGAEHAALSGTKPTTLDQVLAQPRTDELSVPDQLRLALRIASAVLKFNSTSWLSEYWGLRDLCLFEGLAGLSASLQTLHLGVEWTRNSHTNLDTCAMIGVDGPSQPGTGDTVRAALEEAKLIHGIHNTIMYNLGVALLSIGRWTSVDPNDVLGVRRMALQACPLGPKFQDMTQRVLDCDFGYGKDLTKPKLQKAVYDGVVVELESMISALTLDET